MHPLIGNKYQFIQFSHALHRDNNHGFFGTSLVQTTNDRYVAGGKTKTLQKVGSNM